MKNSYAREFYIQTAHTTGFFCDVRYTNRIVTSSKALICDGGQFHFAVDKRFMLHKLARGLRKGLSLQFLESALKENDLL